MGNLQEYTRTRRNNINLIQFTAAILVIYSHAFPVAAGSNAGEIIKDLTASRYSFGNLAVAIFFIFSGFLVSGSFDRKPSVLLYFSNRFFRIFPELLGVILLSAFVLGPCMTTLSVREYFADSRVWIYLKNIVLFPMYWELPGVFEGNVYGPSVNGSLWTIPYQVGLYLGLCFLGYIGLLKYKKVNLVLFVFFVFGYRYQQKIFPGITHFWLMPMDAWMYLGMYFTAGMCAYAYRDSISLNRGGAMIALIALLTAFWLEEYFISMSLFGTYLLLYLSYCTPVFDKPLFNLSYGVYIYGFPVQQAWTYIFGGVMNPYLNTVLSIPCVLVLAYFSDRLIEKPVLTVKHRIENGWKLPEPVKHIVKKTNEIVRGFFDKVIHISWKYFLLVLVLFFVITWYIGSYVPSGVSFSVIGLAPERIFTKGWYPQATGQRFRFVADDVSMILRKTDKKNHLIIRGFIPENFTDVNSVSIYCSGVLIEENYPLNAAEGFDLIFDVDHVSAADECEIRMVFNTAHQWGPGEMDQRKLSGCISEMLFSE